MKKTITSAERKKLKWIKVDSLPFDASRFPDFLIVGPQRTGTSWLFSNLRLHRSIMMPHCKEILFFNRLKKPELDSFRSDRLDWYIRCFDEPFLRALFKNLHCLKSQGRLYKPICRGEASASYASLDVDIIDEIVTINPDIKVILMLREPLERAWSHAMKDLVREPKRRFENVSDAEFKEFFRRPYQMRCADYVRSFTNWENRLKPGNIFVGDFNHISAQPRVLLSKVMDFLELDSCQSILSRQAEQVVNPTEARGIPDHLYADLLGLLEVEREKSKAFFQVDWR